MIIDYNRTGRADNNHANFLHKSVFRPDQDYSFVTLLTFLYIRRKADENGIAYFTKPDTKRSTG